MNKTVLITGASSGIGFELAKVFAKNQYNLILVAQNKEKLESAAKELQNTSIHIEIISINLADPSSPNHLYSEIRNKKIQVDILVNNAGFASYGPFIENDLQKELDELQVNIITLTHLTKLFAKDMVQKKQGKILNVASTAAFLPGPLMAVYYASKAYVLSFSEALSEELIDSGVTVSALCPGPTDTGFVRRASLEKSKLFKGKNMQASEVALIAYEGLINNKRIIIPGLKNKFMVNAIRFIPRNKIPEYVKKFQGEE